MIQRKMGVAATPTVDLSKNGDQYCIFSTSTFKDFSIKFTPGVEFEQETPDGRKLKATITIDDLTLHEVQVNPDGKKVTIERVFSPDELVMTLKVDNVVCTRVYKIVE